MIGVETDITHLSNESLLDCLEQAIMRAEVTSELARLMMSECIARGLIE